MIVVGAALVLGNVTSAQARFEFKLGFKALADQIPDVVGQPVENEHYGPNGDSLQRTSTGLMVWRKADNWTAFTNGYWTWINGPYGVQDRSNEERFEWEPIPTPTPQATATTTPAPTATPIPATPTPTLPPPSPLVIEGQCLSGGKGAVLCHGTVTNPNGYWTATEVTITAVMMSGNTPLLGRLAQLTKSTIEPRGRAFLEATLPPYGNPVTYEINVKWVPTR